MGKKEIKVEKDWFGKESQTVYEDGRKVGEIKDDVVYYENGRKQGTITHESGKTVIRDTDGHRLSETVDDRDFIETLLGLPGKEGIYTDSRKIGELIKREGLFGERSRILNDEPGYDVEPLTRTERERIDEETERREQEDEEEEEDEEWEEERDPTPSYRVSHDEDSDQRTPMSMPEAAEKDTKELERVHEPFIHIYHSDPQINDMIREALNRGVAPAFSIGADSVKGFTNKYKCTRCGHEYYESGLAKFETSPCRMGCSNPPLILRLIRKLKGEQAHGEGKLIESKDIIIYAQK